MTAEQQMGLENAADELDELLRHIRNQLAHLESRIEHLEVTLLGQPDLTAVTPHGTTTPVDKPKRYTIVDEPTNAPKG